MENLQNLSTSSVRPIGSKETDGIDVKKFLFLLIIVVVVGFTFGFVFSGFKKFSSTTGGVSGKTIKTEKAAGIMDKKTFKDSVLGILREGGIDGEGNFHLERPGGLSQNVYLTSSTIDLSQYISEKVKVWGVTFKGEKAGWLMDVGYIEIIN